MNWATLAVISPLVLMIYLALTDWVNLAPWNNVEDLPRKQKILISIANYAPLLFIALAFTQRSPILIVLGLLVAVIDFVMHIAYWWIPYFFGASEKQTQEHQQLFGGTTTFLPAIGDHPIPNAQHVVVGGLMVVMTALTTMTTIMIATSG